MEREIRCCVVVNMAYSGDLLIGSRFIIEFGGRLSNHL